MEQNDSTDIWQKATVQKIQKTYQEHVPLPQAVALQFYGSVIESTKTVAELNLFSDNIIVFEAICEPGAPSLTRDLGELGSNDAMITGSRIPEAINHPQTSLKIFDRHKVVTLVDQMIISEGSTPTDAITIQITHQEFLGMVTMINFVHKNLRWCSNHRNLSNADKQVDVLRQWHALTPAEYQMHQNRAILFMDTSSVKQFLFGKELRRYINETAGFYTWLFKRHSLHRIWRSDRDTDFVSVCNRWRNLNHREIASSVRNGQDLRYTPTSAIPPYPQLTRTIIASGNKSTNNSKSDAFQQFSLLEIFSDCTPEILEASVEHCVNLLEHLKEPLRRLSPDIDAAEWLGNIENLKKQALQPKTIVGVVGHTGAGKSSVINAMLDEERLVPTNCMRACTAVVTEISYNYHEVPYRAEVEFITAKEWERELRILLSDLLDDHGKVSYEAWKQGTEASIAYAKVKAVYPEYTNDMLQKSSVAQLLEHPGVQEVLDGKKEIIESDPAELYQKLQSYVDSKEKTTGVKVSEVWPLIKVVRIYVKAACLSTGAVIVDLPGVHDSNAARVAVAEGYMKHCTGLWIVAPITRAVDDKAAKSLLGETFKRQLKMDGGYDSVTFICSKTDDISISECQDSLGLESQMDAFWTKLNEFKATCQRSKERLDTLKDTKAEYIATLDRIDQQIETWEELKNDVENGNRVFAPPGKKRRVRNSHTSGSPQKKRKSSSPDSEDGLAATETESEIGNDDDDDEDDDDELRQPLTLEVVKKKLTELKMNKRDSRLQRQETDAEMKIFRKQISENKEKEKSIKSKMSAMAISARNEYSRVAIQQDFAAGIKELDHELAEETDAANFNPEVDFRDYDEVAGSLPVFCVSSRAYQKLQGRLQKEANMPPGFQTVEETEIPQLQAHCKKLTEASRRRNCQRFLNGMDQFFNTLRLILSPEGVQVTTEQKIARTTIVENEYMAFEKELGKHLQNTCQHIVKEIEAKITQVCDKVIGVTRRKAKTTVRRWSAPVNNLDRTAGGYVWATYKALCRRNGVYSNGQGRHDWNAELIEPVVKAVAPNWEKVFSRSLHEVLKGAREESVSLLGMFHINVRDKISQDTGPLESFHMLSQQIPLYQQIFNDIFNKQILEIKEKSKDINRMFQPVIAETLDPVYEYCAQEDGTGSFMRMKEMMTAFVDQARDTMFHQSVDVVKKALKELCQSLEEALVSQTGKVLLSVKRDYMSAVDCGVLSKKKRVALNELLKIITESESSFEELAVSAAGEYLISVYDNDERQVKCEDDLGISQEKDNASLLLTPAIAGPITNEEEGNVNHSEDNYLAVNTHMESEPLD